MWNWTCDFDDYYIFALDLLCFPLSLFPLLLSLCLLENSSFILILLLLLKIFLFILFFFSRVFSFLYLRFLLTLTLWRAINLFLLFQSPFLSLTCRNFSTLTFGNFKVGFSSKNGTCLVYFRCRVKIGIVHLSTKKGIG